MFLDVYHGIYSLLDSNNVRIYNLPRDRFDTSFSEIFPKKYIVCKDQFNLPTSIKKRALKTSEDREWTGSFFQWSYVSDNGFFFFVCVDQMIRTGCKVDIFSNLAHEFMYMALTFSHVDEKTCEALVNLLVTEERAEMIFEALSELIYLLKVVEPRSVAQTFNWLRVIVFLETKLRELDDSGFTLNVRVDKALAVGYTPKQWAWIGKFMDSRLGNDLSSKIREKLVRLEMQCSIDEERAALDSDGQCGFVQDIF